jgi:hypothetical protein
MNYRSIDDDQVRNYSFGKAPMGSGMKYMTSDAGVMEAQYSNNLGCDESGSNKCSKTISLSLVAVRH